MRKRLNFRHIFSFALLAGFLGFAFFAVDPAFATNIVPTCARGNSTNPPDLNCAVTAFTNIASLIVGITGSAALLMFVYGGFTMITSAGAKEKVSKGKTILTNAVIGIVLIFTAGYIIDYVKTKLTGGTQAAPPAVACSSSSVASQGYQCMDPSKGRDCSTIYIGCGGQSCCIPLTADELQQQSTPGGTNQ